MAVLTAVEIYQVALTAGFTPDQAVTWTAIALAESNGVTDLATADRVGLWQIDARAGSQFGNLDDPAVSAKAAYELSHQGQDLGPWTDGKSGASHDFHAYIPAVTALTRQVDGDPKPDAATYDRIDAGTSLHQFTATATDSDGDGLTDAFEAMVGTDATAGDSDNDGLTDAFEIITTHTDPLLADTDGDGQSDAAEYTAGTTAGIGTGAAATVTATGVQVVLPDSDGDGLSDAEEGRLGLNAQAADTDDDGMSDSLETSLGTDAKQVDTDHDGLSDVAEIRYGLDPTVADVAPPPVPAAPTVAAAVETAPVTATGSPSVGAVQHMLDAGMAQVGDQYVWGVDTDPDDPDPSKFDCAEFTQWTAHQVGIDLDGASYLQFLQLKAQGLLIPVEQAENTPGAILFHFSSEPVEGGGRPSSAHVALSLGNGKTVEAASTREGVVSKDAGDRFNYAAVLPGLADGGTWDPDLRTWSPGDKPWLDGVDPNGGAAAAVATSTDPVSDPGNASAPSQATGLNVDTVMRGIMEQESGGDYTAENPTSTASGAYQYIDGTWDGYGGYDHAADAPPEVQDAKMRADVEAAYAHFGDWERVIAAHFAGEGGQKGDKANWDHSPGTAANHNPTIRDYVDSVEKHIAELDPATLPAASASALPEPASVVTAPGSSAVVTAPDPSATTHGMGGDSIDLGAPMTDGGADSDHDGLTDEFEKLLGLDPTNADTDHDGLDDGYEVMSSHTDAALVDTDHDGLSDGLEVSLGYNPTLLDSDYDGITDMAEMRFGAGTPGSGLPAEPDTAGLPSSAPDLLTDGGVH